MNLLYYIERSKGLSVYLVFNIILLIITMYVVMTMEAGYIMSITYNVTANVNLPLIYIYIYI